MTAAIRRVIRRHKKRILLLGVALLSLLLAIVCGILLHNVTGALQTQSAARAWQGESDLRFSQITAFLPQSAPLDEAGVYQLRQNLTKAFSDQSLSAAEGGSLLHDAYCGFGTLSVSSERENLSSVKVFGTGGDWFFFHPLTLLNGSYIRETDFMHDRVVLDEDLAWTLFGSSDVVGQTVRIGTRDYLVAGVVRRERDFASRAADGDGARLFMSYEELYKNTEAPVVCYEAVMPNPVQNYAKNLLTEKLANDAAEVVENTNRFSMPRLFSVMGDFAKRSMQTRGIVYPYWENAARYCEDYAALLLLLHLLLLLAPAGMLLLQLFHYGKQYIRAGREKMRTYITTRIEENKKKHYSRTGI